MAQTAIAPAADKHVAAHTVLQRSVVLVLECHFQGNHRKAKLADAVEAAVGEETSVDERLEQQVHVTKRLVDRRALRRANAIPGAAKAYLRTKAIPAHRVFGERAYLVPLDVVEEVDARLGEFATAARVEGAVVAQLWDDLVNEQERALGPMFNRDDYPTAQEVAEAWSIDWSYVSFAAPERLEHVDHALFASAQRKFESRMAEAYDEVKAVLRATLRQLVAEIRTKLTPGEDGKPRVFRNSILDGLTEFLENFHVRNITDDQELGGVVSRLKRLTSGLDADTLRKTDDLRASVLGELTQAVTVLDELVKTGARGIALDGDL